MRSDHDRIHVMVSIMRKNGNQDASNIYLVRHGKTKLNGSKGTDSADRIRGWEDVPLDKQGLQEAKEVGEWFRGKEIDRIYSSDLCRAYDTAKEISKNTDAKITRSSDFRPWDFGIYTGKKSKDVEFQIKNLIENPNKGIKNGESFNSFMDRFLPALSECFKEVEDGKYQNIVIVAHYRNAKAAHAWIGSGMGESVDPEIMMADDIPPASVMQFTHKQGKKWSYKIIPYEQVEQEESNADVLSAAEAKGEEGREKKISKGDHTQAA